MNPTDKEIARESLVADADLRIVRETWTATRSVVQTKMVYCRLFGRIPTMDELRALGAMD